jgi:hypothetical protein
MASQVFVVLFATAVAAAMALVDSVWQTALHPSPPLVFPSSHVSPSSAWSVESPQ